MGSVGVGHTRVCVVLGRKAWLARWLRSKGKASIRPMSPVFLPSLPPSIAAPQTSLRTGEGKARWSKPRPRLGDNSRAPPKGGSAFGHYCSWSLTRSGECGTRKAVVRGWVSSGTLCLPAAPVSCPLPLALGACCGQDEQGCARLWRLSLWLPSCGDLRRSGGGGVAWTPEKVSLVSAWASCLDTAVLRKMALHLSCHPSSEE